MAGHSNMAGWSDPAESVVTDKIPPGWAGTEGEKTLETWITDLDKWNVMCS